jgi:hypothetical protein
MDTDIHLKGLSKITINSIMLAGSTIRPTNLPNASQKLTPWKQDVQHILGTDTDCLQHP